MSHISLPLTISQSYIVLGVMSALNVALYAYTFIRARRENRRAAILRRVLQFPAGKSTEVR